MGVCAARLTAGLTAHERERERERGSVIQGSWALWREFSFRIRVGAVGVSSYSCIRVMWKGYCCLFTLMQYV